MTELKNQTKPVGHRQDGFASIITVMILISILGLITVGFSQLMNRQVKQSLDKQMSTEAYYAAESGLNDVKAYLNSGGNQTFPGCTIPGAVTSAVPSGDISGDGVSAGFGSVKYSCVSLNSSPSYLFFNLQPGESRIFTIKPANTDKMYFSWQNSAATATPQALGSIGVLPQETSVNTKSQTGILRTAIYPVPAGSSAGNTNLALNNASRNYFMYPSAGNGQLNCASNPSPCVTYTNAAADGAFVSGQCNSGAYPNDIAGRMPYPAAPKRFCNSEVTNMLNQGTIYYVRVTALYTPLIGSIQIGDSSNANINIPDAQAVIDVTGTSSGVSQRVRSIVSSTPQYNSPINAVWSMEAVCKLFRVPVDNLGVYGSPEGDGSIPAGDASCNNSIPSNSGGPIDGGGVAPLPPPPPPPPPPPVGSPVTICMFDDGSWLYPAPATCRNVGGFFAPGCQYSWGVVPGSC